MENTDEFLRKKYNIKEGDIDEFLNIRAQHAFYQSVGGIISGKPATGEHQRVVDYLNEKDELEAKKKQSSVMWMLVFSPGDGFMQAVEVKLDSGAEENFITESMVSTLRLRKKALESPQEFNGADKPFTCSCIAQVQWEDQVKQRNNTEFFVLPPTSQIEKLLIREDLIEEFRPKLFSENPIRSVAYAAQKKMTAEETAQGQALREQVAADRAESSRKKEAYEQRKRKEPLARQDKTGTSSSSKRTKK